MPAIPAASVSSRAKAALAHGQIRSIFMVTIRIFSSPITAFSTSPPREAACPRLLETTASLSTTVINMTTPCHGATASTTGSSAACTGARALTRLTTAMPLPISASQRFDLRWKPGKRPAHRSQLRVGRGRLLSRGSIQRDSWRRAKRRYARTRLGLLRPGRLES